MSLMIEANIQAVHFPGQRQPALHDVQLKVEAGEFILISGPAACGKSTLCHCLTGAIPHYFPAVLSGEVKVANHSLKEMRLPQMAGLVGYMMEEPQSQIFSRTIGQDVAFGPENLCLPPQEITKRVARALDFVGLSNFGLRAPESLSGGEAQRAVLAGVLALQPKLLVLDQPTAELDPFGRKAIFDRLAALCQTRHTTVILVTNHIAEVLPYATRHLKLQDGTLSANAPQPRLTSPIKLSTSRTPVSLTTKEKRQTQNPSAPVAALEDCTYQYPSGELGCQQINLQLYQSEMVAVVGLNGSGKTTLAKHFNGLVQPTQGRVQILGRQVSRKNRNWVCQQVGFLFQNPDHQIFCNTVEEEIAFGLKIAKLPKSTVTNRVNQALNFAGLDSQRQLHPYRLSRSYRQLLALASIVASTAPIIIADEPTAGLDDHFTEKVMGMFQTLAKEGRTILFITHDLALAAKYAQRIVVINEHRVFREFPREQLSRHTQELTDLGLNFTVEEVNYASL